MLRKLRLLLAWLVFAGCTLFFVNVLPLPFPRLQLVPALLGAHIPLVLGVLLLTWLFGRVYCSMLCPLGILQDVILWLRRRRGHKTMFRYRPEFRGLRYGILLLFGTALFSGAAIVPVMLDPYSIYGRMVVHLFSPIWQYGTSSLAAVGENSGLYSLAGYDIVWQGAAALALSAAWFFVLALLVWRYGRLYCNTICPVGTLLGTISRHARFTVQIDKAKCADCGLCERSCRASCIDVGHHAVDMSRCLECFDCIADCPQEAIHFAAGRLQAVGPAAQPQPGGMSRRTMLLTSAAAAGTLAAACFKAAPAGVLVPALGTENKKAILPPGAGSQTQFSNRCTACHLCVDRCPQQVLRPAVLEYGIGGFLQPHMDFSQGYCEYECKICSEVCPDRAIQKLTLPQKQELQIGRAIFHQETCLILTDGIECSNCVLHCPVDAVKLVEQDGVRLPRVSHRRCIGCGACEYHCPAAPRAIFVVGAETQQSVRNLPKGQGKGRGQGREK